MESSGCCKRLSHSRLLRIDMRCRIWMAKLGANNVLGKLVLGGRPLGGDNPYGRLCHLRLINLKLLVAHQSEPELRHIAGCVAAHSFIFMA
eukprot:scaffold368145_cov18-Prasinocladus_malaysianus.AAC.1